MKRAGLAVLLLAAGAVSALATDFQLFKVTGVLVYAIALLGLNILAGYNGQISLGHGAFYTLGAYVAAILVVHAGTPHWLALPVAGGVCLVAGILFALPLARIQGVQFALVTFALAMVVPQISNYRGIEHWTGGSQGLGLDQPEVPLGLPLSYDQWIYLLALVIFIALLLAASNLLKGRIGRAAIAIRDHELAAQAMGIHARRFKAMIFGVSALCTGIAGGLSAMALLYVAPANIFVSLGFLIGSAVGGIATLSGAIYGAIFLQAILLVTGAIVQAVPPAASFAVYGVVVIGFVQLLPGGVAGLIATLGANFAARRRP